jgi:DNA-binding CsgD family transcriptional regulator
MEENQTMLSDNGIGFSQADGAGLEPLRPAFPSPCDTSALARPREGLFGERKRVLENNGVLFPVPEQRSLTARERDVLSQIVSGASNKEAAVRLGISHRTIEVHRSRIMEKLGARNTADLVRIVLTANPPIVAIP